MSQSSKHIGIKQAAAILGVTPTTLRAWTKDGVISAFRPTERGHRKYNHGDVLALVSDRNTVCAEEPLGQKQLPPVATYCRVSSHDQKQKGDLDRQKARVLSYCVWKKYRVEYAFDEVGSGMNDHRSKLLKIMALAADGQISKVVVEHKDRLIRFNYNILLTFFTSHGVEVEFMDKVLNKGFENELVEDMLTLMASFSAKIYGKRSHQNKTKEASTK